jgi:hypothetical protein
LSKLPLGVMPCWKGKYSSAPENAHSTGTSDGSLPNVSISGRWS